MKLQPPKFVSLLGIFVLVSFFAATIFAAPAHAQTPKGTLMMPTNLVVAPGGTVQVPVSLANVTSDVYGIDVRFTYNAAKLGNPQFALGTATTGWSSAVNTTIAGEVRFALATGSNPVTAASVGGQVAVITFTALPATTGNVALTFTRFLLDETNANISNGNVRINTAPVASGQSVNTDEDTVVGITLVATDSDPGDTLTYSIVAGPTHGTLSSGIGANRTYTPALDYAGPDSFTFKANDGAADSNTATVNITVAPVNDPPVLATIGNKAVNELALLSFTANATDPDAGAVMTFSLQGTPPSGATITSAGAFSWTPTEAQGPGNYNITVRVTDNGTPGLFDEETIQITANEVNVAPTANPQSVTTNKAVPLAITLTGSDPDLPANTLTYSIIGNPSHGSLSGTAPNITYTPDAGYSGADSFTFRINDGTVNGNIATVDITVRDVVTLDLPELNAKHGMPAQFPVSISGLSGSITALNLTITFPAAHLTFVSAQVTGLTTGWTINTTPGAGSVQVSLNGTAPGGNPTGGNVLLLNFTTGNTDGGTGNLVISSATVNGGATVATVTTGSIYLLRRFDIGGAATYWKNSTAVPDVTLSLTGVDPKSGATAANGVYALNSTYEGTGYTLTPSKATQALDISAFDAALALRHSVGTPGAVLTGDALVVGDTTGDSSVSAADASQILQQSVGVNVQGVTTVATWKFTPASRAFDLASALSGQDFNALLIGDISGNWSPTGLQAASWLQDMTEDKPLPVRIDITKKDDSTAVVTVTLINAPADTLGVDLMLRFSEQFVVTRSIGSSGVLVATGTPFASTLRIGLASAQPMQDGTLATLEVQSTSEEPLSAEVIGLAVNETTLRAYTFAAYLPMTTR